jgi:hypothetical protein
VELQKAVYSENSNNLSLFEKKFYVKERLNKIDSEITENEEKLFEKEEFISLIEIMRSYSSLPKE